MDEARRIKSILYPLARDLRNLHTFVANIQNILHAKPDRFAVGVPPGLTSIRDTLRSLSKSAKAMQEVNDITIRECDLAEQLTGDSVVLMLRSAADLRLTARSLKNPIDQVYRMVMRLSGYLSPTFVFTVATSSLIDMMMKDVEAVSQRMITIKKAVNRLTDYEMTAGLPDHVERRLSLLSPQLGVIEKEAGDIADQMSQLMGKMNQMMELSARLESLMRMGAALDHAIQDLIPSMSILKQLGQVMAEFPLDPHEPELQAMQLSAALTRLDLPPDALTQLEQRLKHHADQYVFPIIVPLSEITEKIKGISPNNRLLSGIESNLQVQQGRFSNMDRLMKTVFDSFEELFEDYKKLTHAA
ncbi:MAG: hypothetical protein WBA20_01795 [Ketobacter sp.]|nr:MAG: hypothetical protein D6160_05740 [Ketobacter sp.]